MNSLKDKVKIFFTQPPSTTSVFHVCSHYTAGINVSSKDRNIRGYFYTPLGSDQAVRDSFSQNNIIDASLLEKKIKPEIKKLKLTDQEVTFLLPDLAQKSMIFSFDSFPNSSQEREKLLWFRIKKQVPLLPTDVRLSYDFFSSGERVVVVASIARREVVEEYESFFNKLQLKVREVGVMTLGLVNLIPEQESFILTNVEQDSFTLLAKVDSRMSLYRQKSMPRASSMEKNVETIVQEVKNTAHYVEDREKKSIQSVWVRSGWLEDEEEIYSNLKEKLPFSVKGIEHYVPYNLKLREKRVLAPLIGHL